MAWWDYSSTFRANNLGGRKIESHRQLAREKLRERDNYANLETKNETKKGRHARERQLTHGRARKNGRLDLKLEKVYKRLDSKDVNYGLNDHYDA